MILKIVPPFWLLFFLLAGLAAHFFLPAVHVFNIHFPIWSAVIGGIVAVAGFLIPLRASNIFAIEKTEIFPTSPTNRALVTRGPFRYSRNPMYLGFIMILLGIAIYLGTLPMFLATVGLFLVFNTFFVPYEEEKMARQFGQEYEAYKHAVRRWL